MKQSYAECSRIVRLLIGPFTHEETAKLIDVSKYLVSDWAAGRTRPRKPAFRRLIEHYQTWRQDFHLDPEPLRSQAIAMLTDAELHDDEPTPGGTE